MLKPKLLAAGVLLASFAPALADYYIIHGPDRHCRVVERYVPGEDRDFVGVGAPSLSQRICDATLLPRLFSPDPGGQPF